MHPEAVVCIFTRTARNADADRSEVPGFLELDEQEGSRMATDKRMNATQWAQACAADGEFMLAARHWTGGLRLRIGDEALELTVQDGAVTPTSNA